MSTIRYEPGHLARLLGLPEPTAEQAEVIAAPLEPLAVIAGAGSGKSETMAARLVWLVANGMVWPERVLGLTFTRKAAAELGQRVRARLAGLRRAGLDVTGGDPAAGPPGGPAAGGPLGGAGAGLLADGAPGAAGGGLAGGRFADPRFTGGRLADGGFADGRFADPRFAGGELGDGLPGGPHEVGGGPASGRLGSRAGADLASPAVLGALDGRVPADLSGGAIARGAASGLAAGEPTGDLLDGEPIVSTYHSYAARLVADHALREALEPTVRLITPAVAWQMAARVVAAYAGPMDAVHWSPQSVTAAVLDLAGELAEHLANPADVYQVGDWLEAASRALPRLPGAVRKLLDCQRTREQLLPLVAGYAAAKRAREVIDYGDQVTLAARIAARHREVGAIERARYQVVLLDEFQDTSHAQLVLLRALFGGGHPVTAVGDPCQSIYGWRGASAGNLARFAREFPAGTHPARVAQLATSFRNTGKVLDVAAVIQRDLRDQVSQVPRLVAPPGRAGRGAVVCALLETAAAEARWVGEQVAGLLRLPAGIAPDGEPWDRAGVQPSDIAVLCRKRSQFALLRAAIEAQGVPVEVVGLGGLLTVPEVADIVATLRVLHDPAESAALARLLTGPRWRIGPRDLVALGRRARELARDPRDPAGPGAHRHGEPAPGGRPSRPGAADLQAGPGGGGTAGTGDGGSGVAHDSTSLGPAAPHSSSLGPAAPHSSSLGPATPPNDALAQAVTDLTAVPGSLVEALDDLGDRGAYSPRGYQRFAALAAELRALRAHVSRPLPDLVGEVERTLGLDIEVAAQPWRDPAVARADLDAFADAAAAFADDEEEPTLGAFLAYLTAAEAEEFGLESGQPSGANAVTLTTVHAAKGLQWAAVVVPGLAAGPRASVFPAKPRVTTRWTENPRLLPFPLRGDAEDLPVLRDLEEASREKFTGACSARELAEERRLAYVAVTRAAYWVACSGYWWGEAASPLGPSRFLEEVRAACADGRGTVAHWAPPPEDGAQNPALAEPAVVSWPPAGEGPRYAAVREAAALVERELALLEEPDEDEADGAGGELSEADGALARAWSRDTGLLLRELFERRAGAGAAVPLPAQLSVSSLVTMAADPDRLAQQIRRPMPRPPVPQARRGTAFHRWLEQRFGQQRLIDPTDLLGAADDPADDPDDADLALLRERFEAGEWSNRWPVDAEVPFETLVAGRTVRGRIDAVFADPAGGGYDVVDWKTGEPPTSAADLRAASVQLAAYRVAWATLARVPLDQVRAAFYYVRHDQTLRPADLLDEAGLAALIEEVPLAGQKR
jgi:DNA helicase-2/ATP-dependent DNA helicase PcrA